MLEYAAQGGGDVSSAARLDEDILQSLVSLRAAAALGSFSRLEDQVVQLKSAVLRRDLTYGAGLTAEGLSARLQSLKGQLSDLKRQTGSSTTRVTAPQPGIFSAAADGCEDITPQQLLTLDGAGLEQLISSADPHSQAASTGKLDPGGHLVSGRPPLPEGGGAAGSSQHRHRPLYRRLQPGRDHDRGAGGRRPVRGRGRAVQRQVPVGHHPAAAADGGARSSALPRVSGCPSPACAWRRRRRRYPDTSETETVSRLGVYAIVNGRAVFKEVEVVSEGADFYVLRSVTTGKNALRAGDEIVLRGTGMFDGKVMEF